MNLRGLEFLDDLEFDQTLFVENCNELITELNKTGYEIPLLDDDGICYGMSSQSLYYAEIDALPTFFIYLAFIIQLKTINISEIVQQFKKQNFKKMRIAFGDTEVELTKVIAFLKAIYDSQELQRHKNIRSNLDRVFSFICEQNELAISLKQANISSGKLMSIGMGYHEFTLIKLTNGYILFEPNNIKFPIKILSDEEEIAASIITNIKGSGFFKNFKDKVALSIHFISFGNTNRYLDDEIANFELNHANNKNPHYLNIIELIDTYRNGLISRLDLALAITDEITEYEKIKTVAEPSLAMLDASLKTFIKTFPNLDHEFQISFKYLNDNAFTNKLTLLHLVIDSNQPYFFKQLLKNKVDISIRNKKSTDALMLASSSGAIKIVQILLSDYAHIFENSIDKSLQKAIRNDHLPIVKLLLPQNVDPKKLSHLMNVAFFANATLAAAYFLELGADPNAQDDYYFYYLHYAVERKQYTMLDVLLNAGANINCKDVNQATPLHVAVHKGDPISTQKLIFQGADLFTKTVTGHSSLSLILMRQKTNLLSLCLKVTTKLPDIEKMIKCSQTFKCALKHLRKKHSSFFQRDNCDDHKILFTTAQNLDPDFFELLVVACCKGNYPIENKLTKQECKKLLLALLECCQINIHLLQEIKSCSILKEITISKSEENALYSKKNNKKSEERNLYLERFLPPKN